MFLPSGQGAMWGFDTNTVGGIVGSVWAAGAVVGAACHGPSGLFQAKCPDGEPLVKDLKINSFTNAGTEQIEFLEIEPFLLESRLRVLGTKFECNDNFTSHTVCDGRLVTGQNPQSTVAITKLLIEAIDTNE